MKKNYNLQKVLFDTTKIMRRNLIQGLKKTMHSLIFNIQILLTVHRNNLKERLITKQTNQYELFNPFYFIQMGAI